MRKHVFAVMQRQLMRTCRSILRELKLASPVCDSGEQWRYITSALRLGRTEQDESRDHKAWDILNSYLTYLRSSRRHRELLDRYQGKGERSIQDTARLVGLALPLRGTETSTQHGTKTEHAAS